ncbi:MAG: hypothetical protein VW076_00065 [Synechococcus sp.]|jgi:hypothetical protein
MNKKEAKRQIDQWHEFYEQGIITAEKRDDHIEAVALLYRLRRDHGRYDLLNK